MCVFRQVKLALLVAGAVAVASAPALAADKEKIAIVELDVPPGMLGISIQVTKAILTEAAKQKRSVITPDELREKLGNKTLNELIKCGDRASCAAERLTPLGATKAVLGRLNHDEKNYQLQLWMVDLNTLATVSDIDRSILIASRRFQKDVETAIPGFLRGEHEAHGTLVINATVPNAQVSLNGEFLGVAPLTQTLKPGKYEMKVEKKSYLTVKRFVSVEVNQKTVEEVRMLLIPGQQAEEDFVPAIAAAKKTEPVAVGASFHPTAPTLVVGILTILAAGSGTLFGVLSSTSYSDLTKGYNPMTNTYAGTRSQALSAQLNAEIANTSFIVAGVGLIATIILGILDGVRPQENETQLDVTPAPTPRRWWQPVGRSSLLMRCVTKASARRGTPLFVVGVVLAIAGCKQLTDPNKGHYACMSADDCGSGYECRAQFAGGSLCFPNGQCTDTELCNGIDDNCDGRIDETFPTAMAACMTGKPGPCGPGTNACVDAGIVCASAYVPKAEVCNGIDDDCNGQIDETFNLATDNANCGACNNACTTGTGCKASVCIETNCSDGIDNDHDGGADCADPNCISQACGGDDGGWNCGRILFDGGMPDGGDGGIDDGGDDGGMTLDAGQPDAGDGGQADAGLDAGIVDAGPPTVPACTPREVICNDGLDNDLDGLTDCADPDCAGLTCASGMTCTSGSCQ